MDKINIMDKKEEILQYIKMLSEQKVITKSELDTAFNSGSVVTEETSLTKAVGLADIMYYIGGAIVFLGIAILVTQNWAVLNFTTRVLATLGAGVTAYFVGIFFIRKKQTETVGSAFFLISALVIPIGLSVVFEHAGFNVYGLGYQSLISVILFAMYLLSYFVFRKIIFILFSILFATWFFFSFMGFITLNIPMFDGWRFSAYRILVAGISYMLLGYAFSKNKYASLKGFLYGFGILGFLGSALILGGWKPDQSIFWELIYPVIVFGTLFVSVYIKDKAFLTFGTIFLMVYILKITSEYFSSGLGWPLALVIAGLSMIGVGYMSLTLKRKYISE